MNRFLRIILIIFGVLVGLLLIVLIAGYMTVRRPFPQTAGTVTIGSDNCPSEAVADMCSATITGGLQAPVEILRDEYGIPHIYADNMHDLFFAQGYVHAQDRFWQMEFWRHTGQGRISEIVGEATVDTDKFIRTAGWNRMADNTIAYYQENNPDYYTFLESYSACFNA